MLRRKLQAHPQITELERIPGTSNVFFFFFFECLSGHVFTKYVTACSTSNIPRHNWRSALLSLKSFKTEGLFFSGQSSLMPESIHICVVQLKKVNEVQMAALQLQR